MSLRLTLTAVALLGIIAPMPALAQAQAPVSSAPAARATVLAFESEAQVNALAAKGRTVVFFFASWCPNCRATVTELNARWSEVNPDLTLVIADYDKEAELKRKYGITYQDTFVLLGTDGSVAKIWNSGGVNGLNANTAL